MERQVLFGALAGDITLPEVDCDSFEDGHKAVYFALLLSRGMFADERVGRQAIIQAMKDDPHFDDVDLSEYEAAANATH